jgi:hypothetical protein
MHRSTAATTTKGQSLVTLVSGAYSVTVQHLSGYVPRTLDAPLKYNYNFNYTTCLSVLRPGEYAMPLQHPRIRGNIRYIPPDGDQIM